MTQRAGVSGKGYSMGAAVGDFDNDGWEDLYVVGVNENLLYRNRRRRYLCRYHGESRELTAETVPGGNSGRGCCVA